MPSEKPYFCIRCMRGHERGAIYRKHKEYDLHAKKPLFVCGCGFKGKSLKGHTCESKELRMIV
jgi:hypothetical protein